MYTSFSTDAEIGGRRLTVYGIAYNGEALICFTEDRQAAEEAASWVENPDTVVLDTSTAHRTAPGWCYGFPELSALQEARIRQARRIAVPGCHASGFIALVYPLVAAGLLNKDALLSCYSLTGYSGGGKKMIAEYEAPARSALLDAPRQYALGQTHKHLKEMKQMTGLASEPVFCPVVSDFYSGMQVTVPLFAQWLKPGASMQDVRAVYQALYTGPVVCYTDAADAGFYPPRRWPGRTACRSPWPAMRSECSCWPSMITSARARPARPWNV